MRWPLFNLSRLKQHKPGQIRVRLTAAGIGYLVLSCVILLMGINYANNLVYALAYFLFAIAILGYLQTRQQLSGLVFGQWRVSPVFQGQEAEWRIQLKKHQGAPAWGLYAESRDHDSAAAPLHLSQGDSSELVFYVRTDCRGELESGTLFLCSIYPFGLFRARISTPIPPVCLVYPATNGALPLPEQLDGRQAHQHKEAESITAMRRYVPGDPMSRIVWKALARQDELLSKEFDGAEGDPVLWLEWRQLSVDVEARLSQLAQWVVEAERKGRETALRIPGAEVMPGSGVVHVSNCLQVLALYKGNTDAA